MTGERWNKKKSKREWGGVCVYVGGKDMEGN